MTRNETLTRLTAILAQFQELFPSLTADNTDGQQANINECTWRLTEVVQEMVSTTAIANKEVLENG